MTDAGHESLYRQSTCGMDRHQNDITIWTLVLFSLVYVDALGAEPKPWRVKRRDLVMVLRLRLPTLS